MTIYQMEQFIVIAQKESLAKASEELFISEPALSRTLKNIERELNCIFFDRVGRNIVLNQNGKKLFEFITMILSEYQKMNSYFSSLNDNFLNEVLTMNIYGLDLNTLSDLTVNFMKLYPNIIVNAYPTSAEKSLLKLLAGESDLVFTRDEYLEKYSNRIDHNKIISILMLSQSTCYLVAPFNSKYASYHSVTLQELVDETFINWQHTDKSEWPIEAFISLCQKENISFSNFSNQYSGDIFDKIIPNTQQLAFIDSLNVCFFPAIKRSKKLIPVNSKFTSHSIYLCYRKSNPSACLLANYLKKEFYTSIKSINSLDKNRSLS